jgi:NAD+ diphosphatase
MKLVFASNNKHKLDEVRQIFSTDVEVISLQEISFLQEIDEIGETLEECVQREVYEEVGLKVKNIRYYKSQPWGFVDDLLVGFYCEVDGDPTIDLDTSELKSGIWTKREDIVLQPDELSLTNEMMKMFKESKI